MVRIAASTPPGSWVLKRGRRGVEEEEGRKVECIAEEMMRKGSIGIMVLGFIRFCRLGGVAYRDGCPNPLRVPRRISGVNSPRCLSRIAALPLVGPSRTAMGL
ncbi:hypothetical protein E3N88_44711 [Mikania micrantha]|uniref:Uncharacterized protein n=1 Tax=Mikania micrantha TaxID=192012 RepID=A0A5N6LB84_9ASTR|nr:hypothetical protein E3N88_44711 [Mikania micrantha]